MSSFNVDQWRKCHAKRENEDRLSFGTGGVFWVGFKFIISTRLAKTGNIRSCFAWAKSGIGLAMNGTPNIRISERSDKNYSTQCFVECSLGATRIEDEKVVQIDCDES